MIVIESIAELKKWRAGQSSNVHFVPTMGALHDGHASLLRKAKQDSGIVVLSIFVNPTQFNDPEDFKKYPITWDQDYLIASQCGVDVIFKPSAKEIYFDEYRYIVTEKKFSHELCGAHRPGHFDGVLSVVLKLFNIVKPHRSYFGEKDFQQLALIQGMVEAYFLDIEIIPCPTLREKDGLAMSSRNTRLTAEERKRAPLIYKIISSAKDVETAKASLIAEGFKVDYVEDKSFYFKDKKFSRRFVAAHLGSVRLIDNVAI